MSPASLFGALGIALGVPLGVELGVRGVVLAILGVELDVFGVERGVRGVEPDALGAELDALGEVFVVEFGVRDAVLGVELGGHPFYLLSYSAVSLAILSLYSAVVIYCLLCNAPAREAGVAVGCPHHDAAPLRAHRALAPSRDRKSTR